MRAITIISILLLPLISMAQEDYLEYDDEVLDNHFKGWDLIGFDLSVCISEEIDDLLASALTKERSITYPWDSLRNHISIQSSSDGNFRSYSYDRRMGGNWHDYSVFVQMRLADSSVVVHQIDTDKAAQFGTYEDAGIFKVHGIIVEGKQHYLTIAYGTHGSGEHHVIARIYGEENGTIVVKPLFNGEDLVVTSQRMHAFEMKYDERTKELSFNEMLPEEDSPWNVPSGKRTVWKLVNNQFRKQQ